MLPSSNPRRNCRSLTASLFPIVANDQIAEHEARRELGTQFIRNEISRRAELQKLRRWQRVEESTLAIALFLLAALAIWSYLR
jgi:hypothetical protein